MSTYEENGVQEREREKENGRKEAIRCKIYDVWETNRRLWINSDGESGERGGNSRSLPVGSVT